jgi:hypothetical protein
VPFLAGPFFVVIAMLTGAAIILPFLLRGTSPRALLWMTALQHKDFAKNFFVVFPLSFGLIPVMAGSVLVCLFALNRKRHRLLNIIQVGKYLLSVPWLGLLLLVPNMGALRFVCSASGLFIWTLVVAKQDKESSQTSFGRMTLALVGSFLILYPFPVAGAQVFFTTTITVLVYGIMLHDGHRLSRSAFIRTTGPIAMCGIIGMFLVFANAEYTGMIPLNLPGARRLRVKPERARVYRTITERLKDCNGFYSMPGLFSFNFWTGQESITTMNANDWLGFLSKNQQQQIVQALEAHRGSCILYSKPLVTFWNRGQDPASSILAEYIRTHFTTAEQIGSYQILRSMPSHQRD